MATAPVRNTAPAANEPVNAPSRATLPAAPRVYAAINRVTARLASEGIGKNRKNTQQGYNFRGIDDIYNALARVLSEEKLVILPRVLSRELTERQTAKGGTLFYVVLDVEFDMISAEDGSKHTLRTVGEAMDSADKASNKAMSAAFKYVAIMAFCIPTEGDAGDADTTTHEDIVPAAEQTISRQQVALLRTLCKDTDTDETGFANWLEVGSLEQIPAAKFNRAQAGLAKKVEKLNQAAQAAPV